MGDSMRSLALGTELGTAARAAIGQVQLEFGGLLADVTVAYETYGTFTGDNAILLEHALTGDAHVAGPVGAGQPTPGWWDELVGPGRPLDTDKWFLVCANVLGGCRGTTGPSSLHVDGHQWAHRWPRISVRDQVSVEARLATVLGIDSFQAIIGGSMGGMRALEWLLMYPQRVRSAVLIATTAVSSADQIATQTIQINAITGDPAWHDGDYYRTDTAPVHGLGLARQIAHLSYRNEAELATRFGHSPQAGENAESQLIVGRHKGAGRFAIQSYLDHHGRKLVDRFDAGSYVTLTDSMNTHDVTRGRGELAKVLGTVCVPVTVGGIPQDRLYPMYQQVELAELIPTAGKCHIIESVYGHDGFLIESVQVGALIEQALSRIETAN
jgi:homoserine O-acetyltransferase